MKKAILLSIIILQISILRAQNQSWSLQGKIEDTEGKPLSSATVTLLDPNDSTWLASGVSNSSGIFEFKNLKEKSLILQISFVGFETFNKLILNHENRSVVHIERIELKEQIGNLDGITVESIAPVMIKKDTLEYHPGAFKTQPNAVVEDLLTRLPGVEVDSDGSIRAQGETVKRVTVDGKEFFGNDPKLATKNLSAEAIDKVQVYDRRSDQAAFTGIDDGQLEKTINLQLKESHKTDAFGTFKGGYGSDNRYELKGNVNRFSPEQQLSFIGMSNNINEQGFGIDDYINFSGGIQNFRSGGQVRINVGGSDAQNSIPISSGQRLNGIMNSHAFGTNLNREFNNKTKFTGSYFYNQMDHQISQETERLNFFPSGNFNFSEWSSQENQNQNHRSNLIIDHQIDTLNSYRSTTNAAYTRTDRISHSQSKSMDMEGNLLNSGNRSNLVQGDNFSLNSEFLLRHRFQKTGRTFSANLQLGLKDNSSEGSLFAENEFFIGKPEKEFIRQEQIQDNIALDYGANLSYTEPLGGKKHLELVYNFRQNHHQAKREVFDRIEESLVFNEAFSNRYHSAYTYHRPGTQVSYNGDKYDVVAGVAYQSTQLNGEIISNNTPVNTQFDAFLPSLRFNYSFSKTKNLNFNYQTSITEPNIEQLQPLINNADPLNIYVGNPQLEPAYLHIWTANYHTFDMGRFINFFSSLNLNYTQNAIINSQSIDVRQVRTIMPVNVKESLIGRGTFSFGFPLKAINSRFRIGSNIKYQTGQNLINEVENNIRISNIEGNFRYDYNWKEWVNLGLSANSSRQHTGYSLSSENNQLFFNQTYTAEANLMLFENYMASGNFSYLIYNSQTTGFREEIPLLNASLSRFILKDKKGELKLSASNLLNQHVGVSQSADINFIEQTVTNNLGRFVTLSFIYKLGNNMNSSNTIPRGGGIHIKQMN